jgi:hypothetical protein
MLCPPARDFDGALGSLPAANVFEVDEERLILAQQGIAIGFQGRAAVARVDEVDYIQQRADGIDVDSTDHGGFAVVGFRNDEAGNLTSASLEGDGQRAEDARTPPSSESSPTKRQSEMSSLVRPP